MKKFEVVIWSLILFFLTGCDNKGSRGMLTDQKMETYCIGRHVFDVPAGFEPSLPLSAIFRTNSPNQKESTISVNLLATNVTSSDFAVAVAKRRNEIVASTRERRNILKDVVTRGTDSTLFRISRIEDSYMSELHLLKSRVYLTAEARSYSGLFDVAEKELFGFANDIDLAKEIATPQSGFCLGPFSVSGRHEAESMSVTFRSDKQADISITIGVDTYGRDDPVALLQRVSGPSSLLEKVDVRSKVLRKGQLDVAGMQAQEWLGSVLLGENRDKKQFGFALETRRAKPGPASPRIHIELDSGKQDRNGVAQPDSLSAEQAIAMWDSIVSSIRLRQGAANTN